MKKSKVFVKIFLFFCFLYPVRFFSAGLIVRVSVPLQICVVFDNGQSRIVDTRIGKKYKVDAGIAGIKKIQWVNPYNKKIYEVQLDIKGHEGWKSIVVSEKFVYIKSRGFVTQILSAREV